MARSDADGQMQEFLLHARSIHLTIAATAFLPFAVLSSFIALRQTNLLAPTD